MSAWSPACLHPRLSSRPRPVPVPLPQSPQTSPVPCTGHRAVSRVTGCFPGRLPAFRGKSVKSCPQSLPLPQADPGQDSPWSLASLKSVLGGPLLGPQSTGACVSVYRGYCQAREYPGPSPRGTPPRSGLLCGKEFRGPGKLGAGSPPLEPGLPGLPLTAGLATVQGASQPFAPQFLPRLPCSQHPPPPMPRAPGISSRLGAVCLPTTALADTGGTSQNAIRSLTRLSR